MESKITGGKTEYVFTHKILSRYDVKFYRCEETGFIQTEEPFWLGKAYSSAITKLDVGLVMRNQNMTDVTAKLLYNYFDHEKQFLDFGGGYGLFTRMMRDKGYDFYNTDIYCKNIFAEYHDLSALTIGNQFEVITAFEVTEHMPDPLTGLADILKHGKNIFFSTEIIPTPTLQKDWWYFSFETGQHISFYTVDALKYIANKFNLNFYTDNKSLHLFTEKELPSNPFSPSGMVDEPYLIKKIRAKLHRYDRRNNVSGSIPDKPSLMSRDIEDAKKRIG